MSLPRQTLSTDQRAEICDRYVFLLDEALRPLAVLAVRAALLEALDPVLRGLVPVAPTTRNSSKNTLAVMLERIGEVRDA